MHNLSQAGLIAAIGYEKGGQSLRDHRGPSTAILIPVEVGRFPRDMPDLDLPFERFFDIDADRQGPDVLRSDQRGTRNKKAHEREFVGFSAISW